MPLPVIAAGGWIASLISVSFIVSIIVKVVAAFGFTVFAFIGLDIGLDALESQLNSHMSGIPLGAKQLLDMAGITTIVSWIIGAYAFRLYITAGKSILANKGMTRKIRNMGR